MTVAMEVAAYSVFGLAGWSLAIVLGGGNDVGSNVAMPAL